jgi:opacity protein-like surface antigen
MTLVASLLSAHAQIPWATEAFSRQNKFDVYGIGEYLHQGDTTFTDFNGEKAKLKLEDTGLGGIGLAFHFNDFIAIHTDFLFGPATFRSQVDGGPSYTLGDDGFIQSGRLNVDYNIINRRLTPFITAGIGYQYFEVDQHDYDYYYSYYYYYETDFTWNVGAGVRWNVTDNFFIKATGGAQWLKYEGADNVTTQIEAALAIGCTFP